MVGICPALGYNELRLRELFNDLDVWFSSICRVIGVRTQRARQLILGIGAGSMSWDVHASMSAIHRQS